MAKPGKFERGLALGEVVLVFAATHVAYRSLKQFTWLGHLDAATNFIPGAVMTLVTIAILLLCRRDFEAYGLGTKRLPNHISLGLVFSLLLIGSWAAGLALTGFRFSGNGPPDPHGPHQLTRLMLLAAIALPGFLVVLVLLRTGGKMIMRLPPLVSVPVIFALLAVLPLTAARFHRYGLGSQTLWLFLGAGFGEEIFFRGYIQSRVDQTFGCPYRIRGFQFGPGLLVSSLLFGLIHALNTVDYFHGRIDFGWSYGLQAFGEGIFFGALRAQTGSVVPGAIMHGVLDVFARVSSFLP